MNADQNIPQFGTPLPIDLFLESADNAYIYDDLRQFEHYFLQHLIDLNHNFDNPIGLWSHSSDELVFIIAACWRLGIPFIPFDAEMSGKELSQQLQEVPLETIITDRPDDLPETLLEAVPIDQFSLTEVIKPDFTPEEWVQEHKNKVAPDQIFGYFFTSGTSGTPKIVPLKRRQMLYAARASLQNIKPGRNGFWLLCLPLHHIGGVSVILRSVLYGSGIFRMNAFDSSRISRYLGQDSRFQATSFVPTMLKRLLENPDFKVHDEFQAILLGGGPIDTALIDECFDRGIPLIASYGMTESCAQIAANPLMTVGDLSRPKESAGKVFPPNNIEIRDKTGAPQDAHQSGQIWLSGPQVFDGYLNKSRAAYFDSDNWFNTGDYGYLNTKGELFIESRRSDLIISGGENISPEEVEQALRQIEFVREAAVVGVPDEEWGEKVVAVIVTENNQEVDSDEIRRKLRAKLRAFKIPKKIIRTDTIPRTTTGKILRNQVKERCILQMD